MKRMGIKAAILALCLAFLCFFGGALLRYARPMENASYDFSLSWAGEAMPENWQYDQKGWSVFTLEGGERRELAADGLGGFYGAIEPGGVFYFSRVLTEAAAAPTLQIAPSSRAIRPCEFILVTDLIGGWELTAQIVLIGCLLTLIPALIKRNSKLPLIPGLALGFVLRLLFCSD